MNDYGKMLTAGLLLTVACLRPAHADVVVIVSAKSSATTMTAESVSQIFLGKSSAMKPVDAPGSPLRSQFYTKVAGKDDAQVRAIWSKLIFTGKAKAPVEMPSSADVVKAIAADPEAIGYVDRSAVDSSVKVVYTVK